MPSTPEFEYTYRWADGLDAAALEARDQALENHLGSFGASSCTVDFEYPYRWEQILATGDVGVQIQLLESNMSALEQAVNDAGGCVLEFPFRWSQFWEALKAGESWAIGIAEENDRAIEFRFGRCVCATLWSITLPFTWNTFEGNASSSLIIPPGYAGESLSIHASTDNSIAGGTQPEASIIVQRWNGIGWSNIFTTTSSVETGDYSVPVAPFDIPANAGDEYRLFVSNGPESSPGVPASFNATIFTIEYTGPGADLNWNI